MRARVVVGADGASGRTAAYVGVDYAITDLGLEVELHRQGDPQPLGLGVAHRVIERAPIVGGVPGIARVEPGRAMSRGDIAPDEIEQGEIVRGGLRLAQPLGAGRGVRRLEEAVDQPKVERAFCRGVARSEHKAGEDRPADRERAPAHQLGCELLRASK